MKSFFLSLFLLLCSAMSINATTWDEPWQRDILEKAGYFILGKVLIVDGGTATVSIEKSFGKVLNGTITIDDFFMLRICSTSGGHGPEMFLKEGYEGYFFLKKNDSGNYSMPTPTSGFDYKDNDRVYAGFLNSIFKVDIPLDIYEKVYNEIWKYYKKGKADTNAIITFLDENLKASPAFLSDGDEERFYLQIAALETIYHLKINHDIDILKKFIDCENTYLQTSAVRALSVSENKKVSELLTAFVLTDNKSLMGKTIAIYCLIDRKDKSNLKKIKQQKESLSDEFIGFGLNIMDPRVCTYFPSPYEAIESAKI